MQLARKLVGGELQQITYREYLPIILGSEAIDDLTCPNTQYDPNEDPSTRLFHFVCFFSTRPWSAWPGLYRLRCLDFGAACGKKRQLRSVSELSNESWCYCISKVIFVMSFWKTLVRLNETALCPSSTSLRLWHSGDKTRKIKKRNKNKKNYVWWQNSRQVRPRHSFRLV